MAAKGELLSIVIPMFNARDVIGATLDSIARQKDVEAEILVVDDVSTDGSAQAVRAWHKTRPHLPLRIIAQPQRGRTLKARLAGVRAANGADIMFVDADDRLMGERALARALAAKRRGGFDIAHFRSQFRKGRISEVYWNAPMSEAPLYGADIFSTYTGMSFPPVLVWGKIYSASLLRQVAPLAEQLSIFRLEDVFLCSLLMLFARSYCPCNEYAYLYEFPDTWPPEKFAGRVHDLHVMRPFFAALLAEKAVPRKDAQNFMTFLEKRLAFNLNELCRTMTEELGRIPEPGTLMARLEPSLAGLPLVPLLCPVLAQTVAETARVAQRMDRGTTRA